MKSKFAIISAKDNDGVLNHTVICEGFVYKEERTLIDILFGERKMLVQLPIKVFKSEMVKAHDGSVYDFGLSEARELLEILNG